VLANQRLVRKLIVAKYGKGAAHDEDLYQAGLVGLCIAASAYEQNKIRGRFSLYARTVILRELGRSYLTTGQRLLLLPKRRRSERAEILRHADALTRALGRAPTPAEIVASWPGTRRRPWLSAVERALRPEPVLIVAETCSGNDIDPGDAEIDVEDLIDAKRRFERLTAAEQERLRGGGRG
jgi:DNA-directed RNA polymerase specialized sigma subunit